MRAIGVASVFLVLFVAVFTAKADENSDANRLVVESVQLIQQAKSASAAAERLELLQRAKQNLKDVIARYPGSNTALLLATGQSIGNISLEAVLASIEVVKKEVGRVDCLVAPTPACLLAEAIETAKEAIETAKTIESEIGTYGIAKSEFEAFGIAIDVAIARAQIGDISGAFAEARRLKYHPNDQVKIFAAIARAQITAGDSGAARKTLAEARSLESNKFLNKDKEIKALIELVPLQIEASDIKGSRDGIAVLLQEARTKDSARVLIGLLSDVVEALIKKGRLPEAKTLVKIPGPVINYQEVTRNRKFVMNSLSYARGDVAAAMIATDDIAGVKKMFDDIPDKKRKAIILFQIARAHAKAGDFAEAMKTRELIADKEFQISILFAIIEARTKRAEISAALAVAHRMLPSDRRVLALRKIALAQFKNDELTGARDTLHKAAIFAKRFVDPEEQANALFEVAQGFFDIGDVSEAQKTMLAFHNANQKIQNFESRNLNLIWFAEKQFEFGDSHAARNALAEALPWIKNLKDEFSRGFYLQKIRILRMKIGDTKGAINMAQTIPKAIKRARAYIELAVVLAGK